MRISVAGQGEQRTTPEEAVLHLGVGFDGTTRESVLRDTTDVHERISAKAEHAVDSGAVRVWHAQTVRVEPYERRPDESSDPEVRYRSNADLWITFTDVDALGEWIVEIGNTTGASIAGVTWKLTDETETRLTDRARELAVEDAIKRAATYAKAAGRSASPALVGLYEPGLRPAGGAGPDGAEPATMLRGRAAGTPQPVLTLTPADITVRASVTADFDVA